MKQILLGVAGVAAEVVLGPLQQYPVRRRFLAGEIPLSQGAAHPDGPLRLFKKMFVRVEAHSASADWWVLAVDGGMW